MAGINFDIVGNNSDVIRKVSECQKAFAELGNTAEIQGKRIDAAFEKISLKSLERVIEIMKNFPKEVQGITSFQKQIDGLEKHIERVNQRIASVGSGKLGSAFSDVSSNVNIGDVLKRQAYEGAQAVNTLTEKIIQQKILIKDIEHDVRTLSEAYKRAGEGTTKGNALFANFKEAKAAVQEEKEALFGLQTQQAQARLSVRKLKDEQSLYQKETQKVVESNESMSVSFKKALGVIGGVAALKQLGSEIIKVRGEFQAMQTAIETLVGKDMAGNLIPQIKELAKVSPLTLSDMVGAEKMMLGFNIKAEDTIRYLQALGDISMGNSQKFNSLTLAFSQMSATGKLMGQDLNQMINAGFNPLQTISEKTGKSIATLKEEMSKGAISTEMVQKAFIDATSEGGRFFGMSENASKTINGQLSMMQDALDEVFNEIGTKGEGAIMSGIQATTSLIHNYETVGKVLTGLIATFGVYKAATIAYYAITKTYGIYDIATKELQLAATMRNIVATKAMTIQQALLNKTMLANPYVLIATLVVGAAAAMWALHDSTSEAEKAQKRFNERKEEAAKRESEHKQKIDELLNSARDESLSTLTRQKSLEELRKEYPKIFAEYNVEKLKLAEILEIKQKINAEDDRKAIVKQKTDLVLIEKEIKKYEELVKVLASGDEGYIKKLNELRLDRDNLLKDKGAGISEQFVSNLKNIDEKELKHYADVLQKKISGKGKDGAIKIKLPIDAKGTLSDEAVFDIKTIKALVDSVNSETKRKAEIQKADRKIGKDWLKDKKEAYDQAIKDLEAYENSKKELTKEEYEKGFKEKKEKVEIAKKSYEDAGGQTTSQQKKELTAADKLRKQQESIREQQDKNAQLEKKQSLDRQRQQQDLEHQAAQAEIDALDDSFEKKEKQRALNNKKEIQALERQKEDYVNAVIQFEKEKFDAQEELNAKNIKGYNKKTFDSSTVKVDSSAFNGIINNTSKKQLNDKVREQEDSWNEYLIKFGDYQQKRKAIIEKYDKLIKEAEDAGKAATHEKDKQNAVDDLDNSIKNSSTLMGQLFADASQKSVSEIQKVIEKAELLMQYLESVKDEKGNAQIGGKTVSKKDILGLGVSDNTLQNLGVSTEEVEALRNAISKLKGELGGKSPFILFESQIDAAIGKISQGGNKNIAQGITEIGGAIASFSPAISQFGQALGNIFGSDDLGNKIAGVSDALGGVGQTAAGVGQIMSGDIVGGVMSAVSGISSVVSALDGLFGADYSEYDAMVAKYDVLLDVWDELLDKKKAYIKESYGAEATKAGEEALRLLNSEKQITKELASSRLDAGKSAGSHSINYRMWKGSYDYNGQNWKDVAGDISNSLGGVDFSSMWSMLEMSSEQLEWIKTNYSGLWAHMDGDFKGYLDNIIQYGETEKEIIASVKEQITGISLDSFQDSYVNMLSDMDSTNEDFADNFEEYLKKSILQSLIAKNYTSKIQSLYDSWATAGDDDVYTDDEINKLRDKQQKITDEMLAEREELMKTMGWDSSSGSSQDSTQKGFPAMDQDTGNELNGRFTALQISNEEIKNTMLLVLGNLSALSATSIDNNGILSDMRNLAVMSNSYLEDIARHTKVLLLFGEKLDKIESNTKGLSSR